MEAAELDLVLVATMSHEQLTPSAAALVTAELGASRAGAIDVGAACSGFVSGLSLASSQIESRRADAVLVVGADLLSRLIDHDDRGTAALFGDGAGAVLVLASEGGGRIGPFVMGADGARGELITAARDEGLIRMNGHDTFRQAVNRLSRASVESAAAAGRELDEIDLFVYHQANGRILAAVAERLDLDRARVVDCVGRYGNTSAASIPIALGEAGELGLLTAGSTVLMAAFGGGLTWAATVVEWGARVD
jgi:3-oxoacyl-[acyl-carrier-protein] synthase-3